MPHDAATVQHVPPWFTLLPFVTLLLCVAVLPLVRRTAHWWESNGHKLLVSLACGAVATILLLATLGQEAAWHGLGHAAADFVPFIVLLGTLYVISGGILITGDLRGTPTINTALLAVGAVLANVLGTTGASMLLIRPLLRANAGRRRRAHSVIFFIFLVSNMGGLLLPIGDPPLFLGYLRGVPFAWTLQLWDVWLTGVIAVLLVFYLVDSLAVQGEKREGAAVSERGSVRAERAMKAMAAPQPDASREALAEREHYPRIRISGGVNVVLLMGVVWATAALVPGSTLHWTKWEVPTGAREAVLLLCATASVVLSPRQVRSENRFTMGPIMEVAALFSGLFVAMQPALQLLAARGGDLGITTPAQFFWATGSLSSFLDNAPTYLVFANVGILVSQPGVVETVAFDQNTIDGALLAAISCGAVFMGAMTYIGNGPNLMVAAIAREDGVPMPSFFGYMVWSAAVLLPIFALVTFVFFA